MPKKKTVGKPVKLKKKYLYGFYCAVHDYDFYDKNGQSDYFKTVHNRCPYCLTDKINAKETQIELLKRLKDAGLKTIDDLRAEIDRLKMRLDGAEENRDWYRQLYREEMGMKEKPKKKICCKDCGWCKIHKYNHLKCKVIIYENNPYTGLAEKKDLDELKDVTEWGRPDVLNKNNDCKYHKLRLRKRILKFICENGIFIWLSVIFGYFTGLFLLSK